jgi:hypothetical protein
LQYLCQQLSGADQPQRRGTFGTPLTGRYIKPKCAHLEKRVAEIEKGAVPDEIDQTEKDAAGRTAKTLQ